MSKNKKIEKDETMSSQDSGKTIRHHTRGPGTVRKVNPLGYRVLIRLLKESDVTETGLYLPEGAKQNMQESLLGEVIEVASAVDIETDEEANVSGVPLGATVLIPKTTGVRVPWDDDLRIIETKDILAIVEEVEIV